MRKEYYEDFLEFAEEYELWDTILKESIICDNCKSYITDSYKFYTLIDDILYYLESKEFKEEFEIYEILYGKLDAIRDRMNEVYCEEYDPENFPYIAVIFNDTCTCNSFFIGEKEGKEDEEDPFDLSDPNISISRYIGPKIRWE
ncbi:MAG: hypothetical protein JW932_19740 [Deltaproteobacteria bacterium]|nr:hypothetical protein [Deltaproteobacteria bacterium]